MALPLVFSWLTIRILVKPLRAEDGIIKLTVAAVAGTQFKLAVAPLEYTFSPASIKSPSWFKSTKIAKPLV